MLFARPAVGPLLLLCAGVVWGEEVQFQVQVGRWWVGKPQSMIVNWLCHRGWNFTTRLFSDNFRLFGVSFKANSMFDVEFSQVSYHTTISTLSKCKLRWWLLVLNCPYFLSLKVGKSCFYTKLVVILLDKWPFSQLTRTPISQPLSAWKRRI